MTDDRSELREAAEKLDAAREHTDDGDARERLATYAEQVEKLVDADRGPDHGRLDRLTHNLRDVQGNLADDAAESVDAALAHVRAYRETVEGV